MADDDTLLNDLHSNRSQILRNTQANFNPSRIVPPIPTNGFLLQPPNTPAAANFTRNNRTVPRNYRRVPRQQEYIPSIRTFNDFPGYPNRPYSNIDSYNIPFNTFRQSSQLPPFQSPFIIAAGENVRPAFEQIYTVIESFNSISMMLESTFNTMHMSFHSILGVADNFTRLRVFITKIYSAIVSFRLARWFLTKIMHLLRMVNGNQIMNDEENVWASLSTLSTTGVRGNNTEQSWPLVIFSGILVAIPYVVYKLCTPKMSNSEILGNNETFSFKSINDWDNQAQPDTIPLVKGQYYGTTNEKLALTNQNGGWLFVENENGQRGFVPLTKLANRRSNNTQSPQPITSVVPGATPQTVNQNDVICEQIEPLEGFDGLENDWN